MPAKEVHHGVMYTNIYSVYKHTFFIEPPHWGFAGTIIRETK